ncbi:MAG: hypothetical protein EAZ27_01160 [Cytophagales bacterium]|nr:MAG: hypothetical protein EAZ27_01160 [Cytophagales bacterium]
MVCISILAKHFKMKNIKLGIIFIFLITNFIYANSNKTIVIDAKSSELDLFLKNLYTVLPDSTNALSIDSVLKLSAQFKPSEFENHLGFRYKDTWWLKIVLQNKDTVNHDYVFEFANPNIDSIEVYKHEFETNTIKLVGKTGDQYPFSMRNLPSRNFDFVFQANKKSTTELYLKVRHINESLSLPIYLYSVSNFYKNENLFVFLISVCIGILAFMALFGFALFCFQKRRIYLYYMAYVLCIIGWQISNYGIGYQLIWSNYPSFHFVSATIFSVLYIIFFLLFIQDFLAGINLNKSIKTITSITCIVLIFIIFILLIFQDSIKYNILFWDILFPFLFITILYMGYLVFLGLFKKSKNEVLLMGLFYLLVVGTVLIAVIREMIPLPINFFTEHIIACMAFMEVLCLGLALAYQLYRFVIEREQYLRERNQLQSELLNAEIEIQERERTQISADLHDDLGPTLALVKLALSNSKKMDIAFALNQIDFSIDKIRNISHELHPSVVSALGLKTALQNVIKRIEDTKDLKIDFRFSEEIAIPNETALQLYRIVSEALHNIIKHAQADICNIVFEKTNNWLLITISDNGIGINNKLKNKGIGLKNIQSRVAFMKGTLEIIPNKPKGTIFKISLPLN